MSKELRAKIGSVLYLLGEYSDETTSNAISDDIESKKILELFKVHMEEWSSSADMLRRKQVSDQEGITISRWVNLKTQMNEHIVDLCLNQYITNERNKKLKEIGI